MYKTHAACLQRTTSHKVAWIDEVCLLPARCCALQSMNRTSCVCAHSSAACDTYMLHCVTGVQAAAAD
jgi:hypothetical protein